MIAENAKILDPLSAFMQYYNDVFAASPIPTPLNVSLQRVSALSEYGGLWMVNESREVVRIGLVVQMSQFRDDSKYGQYMDMNAYNSQVRQKSHFIQVMLILVNLIFVIRSPLIHSEEHVQDCSFMRSIHLQNAQLKLQKSIMLIKHVSMLSLTCCNIALLSILIKLVQLMVRFMLQLIALFSMI